MTSFGRPSVRSGACSSIPTRRFANPCCASSTRRSPITYALEAIAVGVSMFGIAATLLALALERRREIAMLRLVGAESRHLRRMIVIEAGALGVVAQAVGLAVGLAPVRDPQST